MKITLTDYDSAWAQAFAGEALRLEQALAAFSPRVEHVGSTAVPGLPAKPVIDMLIGLPPGSNLDMAAFSLLPLGYVYIRDYERFMPERRYLIHVEAPADAELPAIVDSPINVIDQKGYAHTRHIHMVEIGTEFWTRLLAFRDYLRTHDQARDAYAALKQELAQQDWESGNHYAEAKSDFVREIEAKAADSQ